MNLKPQIREIFIDNDKIVTISDQVFFQTGDDGVHQWESGIVLSRYLLSINPIGSILELGSGSGLAGITASKYTRSACVTMTDFNRRVLDNIQENILKNSANARVVYLDWRDVTTYTNPADIVVGSDLIYDGAPIQELVRTILYHMNEHGVCYIVMPDKRKMTPVFLEEAERVGLDVLTVELKDWFTCSPHRDVQKGFRDFAELTMRKYFLYTLTRKSSI